MSGRPSNATQTGARVVVRALEAQGVSHIFRVPRDKIFGVFALWPIRGSMGRWICGVNASKVSPTTWSRRKKTYAARPALILARSTTSSTQMPSAQRV